MLLTFLLGLSIAVAQADDAKVDDADTKSESKQPEPWLLTRALQGTAFGNCLTQRKIEISGWTDMSFTASSARSSNLPIGFNHRANDFLLQQNWLRIDCPVDTSGGVSWGFRTDTMLPGSDYRFTLARGLFSDQLTANNGGPNPYGFDPIQFYAEAYVPNIGQGMNVKVGHFFSLLCNESNDAVSNALWSHSYLSVVDPFTHTGVLTTTKLSECWSVHAGLVLGSDIFIDPADSPTFIGGFKWVQADQKNSVYFTAIVGSGRFDQTHNFNNVNVFNLIYTHQFSKKCSYALDSLVGYETNVPQLGSVSWYGFANYLSYDFSDNLKGTARVELFDDPQGQRTGFPGLYTAATLGLNIKAHKAIIFRPEIRYDYNAESRPFQGQHGVLTAGSDLIVRW